MDVCSLMNVTTGRCGNTGNPCSPCPDFKESPFPRPRREDGSLEPYVSEAIIVGCSVIHRQHDFETLVAYYRSGQWVSSWSANHYTLARVIVESGDFRDAYRDGWIRISVWNSYATKIHIRNTIILEAETTPPKGVVKSIVRKLYDWGIVGFEFGVSAHSYSESDGWKRYMVEEFL